MQMTMVTLLWNAASIGNTPMVRPQPEKLWQQVSKHSDKRCSTSDTHVLSEMRE